MPKAPYHCSAPDCAEPANVEVYLYDVYSTGEVFWELDRTCTFLCTHHMLKNESEAKDERRPRGFVQYPYANKNGAKGFTIYRALD